MKPSRDELKKMGIRTYKQFKALKKIQEQFTQIVLEVYPGSYDEYDEPPVEVWRKKTAQQVTDSIFITDGWVEIRPLGIQIRECFLKRQFEIQCHMPKEDVIKIVIDQTRQLCYPDLYAASKEVGYISKV